MPGGVSDRQQSSQTFEMPSGLLGADETPIIAIFATEVIILSATSKGTGSLRPIFAIWSASEDRTAPRPAASLNQALQ